jgi:glutamyl-tRNA reductase
MPADLQRDLPVLLVGVDHRCAELDLRERVSYDQPASEELLVRLIAKSEIKEALLLSTCNRTEIYLRPENEDTAFQLALDLVFLAKAPEISEEGRFYVKRGEEAARHLLSVAAGLESMVLGEPEILGQVKQAANMADALSSTGAVLRRLVRSAIAAGGRARRETAIAEGPVSFGYSAVELANNIFVELAGRSILMLGAGDTATAVSRSLLERGATEIRVANRSAERARLFCEEFPEATSLPFEERMDALIDADLVVAATSAPEAILTRDDLARAMHKRRNRPLLIVDLGVPRDVDPRAGELPNLFLHNVDSLAELIQRTLQKRKAAIPAVSRILDEEIERFGIWFGSLAAAPVVALLHRRAEQIRRQELASLRDRFPESLHEDLETLTKSIVRKLLHHPSSRLRETVDAENLEQLAAVRDLFQLDDEA